MEQKINSKREGNEKRMQREIHNSKYCKRKSESGKVENIPRTGSTKLIQKERETRNTFENRGNRKINVKIEGKIRITRNISKKRGKDENNSKTEENERGNSEAPSSGGGTSSNEYIRGRVFRGSRKQVKRKYSLFKLAV